MTSQHVLIDELSGHYPNRIEIGPHVDPANLGASTLISVPLYVDRQGNRAAGTRPNCERLGVFLSQPIPAERGVTSYTVKFDIKGGHREQSP